MRLTDNLITSNWTTSNVSFADNVHTVESGGHMSQLIESSEIYGTTPLEMRVEALYNQPFFDMTEIIETHVIVTLNYWDQTRDVLVVPLRLEAYLYLTTVDIVWLHAMEVLEVPDDKQVHSILVNIANTSGVILEIREVKVVLGYQESAQDNEAFESMRDKSILYGLDKDKPVLRRVQDVSET